MSIRSRRSHSLGAGLFATAALLTAASASAPARAADSDPNPVLMVIADQQDFYYQEYGDTRMDPTEDVDAAMGVVAVEPPPPAPTLPAVNQGGPQPEPPTAPELTTETPTAQVALLIPAVQAVREAPRHSAVGLPAVIQAGPQPEPPTLPTIAAQPSEPQSGLRLPAIQKVR